MTSTTASTLLGPLTTTYTPTGSICNSIHYDTNPTGTGWFALGGIAADSTSCMPTGFTRPPQYYYSPGICPSGYTAACSSLFTTDNTVTTVGTCCPVGYACRAPRGNNIYGCTSFVTEDTVLTVLSVSFETITTGSTTIYTTSSGIITTTLTADEHSIEAYGVIVQRQSDDAPFVATTSSSSSATTSATGYSIASATETKSSVASTATASSPGTTSSSSNMSTGAKVGIGIGVSAGVILLLILAFFLVSRRRAKNTNNLHHPVDSQQQYTNGTQWSGQPIVFSELDHSYGGKAHAYTDQQYVSSDGGPHGYNKVPVEMPTDRPHSELPGDHYHQRQ